MTEEEDATAAAASALADALAATDGDPDCARCPKPADYFLYEAGRVEKFVCWEHVSPFSAAVEEAGEDTDEGDDGEGDDGEWSEAGAEEREEADDRDPESRSGRPVALSL